MRIVIFIVIALTIAGCATAPVKEGLQTYYIHDVTYYPLQPLCAANGINLDYDIYTRSATLTKSGHKVNLAAGQSMILVDNIVRHLKHPVEVHQGILVVPAKFKEQVVDVLFKGPAAIAVCPLLKIKRVVIDAGHGGKDPGAIGKSGLREKDVTLDLARRLAALLKSDGVEVVMTRSTDKYIPLQGRVNITNSAKADLFVSIHANANRVRSLSGFEVYYVSPKSSDSIRALMAAKKSRFNFDSNYFAGNSTDLKAIVWDLVYTNSRAESIELARAICKAADEDLETRIIGAKGANFYVLKGAQVPAVLIEVGFLSNAKEERMLKNGFYRQQVVSMIERGVKNYAQDLSLAEAGQ